MIFTIFNNLCAGTQPLKEQSVLWDCVHSWPIHPGDDDTYFGTENGPWRVLTLAKSSRAHLLSSPALEESLCLPSNQKLLLQFLWSSASLVSEVKVQSLPDWCGSVRKPRQQRLPHPASWCRVSGSGSAVLSSWQLCGSFSARQQLLWLGQSWKFKLESLPPGWSVTKCQWIIALNSSTGNLATDIPVIHVCAKMRAGRSPKHGFVSRKS